MSRYDEFDVPVPGGDLHVGRWAAADPGAPVVLAAHGVTANHLAWELVAEHAAVTLVAPDLRGRGRSAAVRGPAGMRRHAEDLRAVLDYLGVDRAGLVGHSMGGFVVTTFAEEYPERTAGALLVDGGLALPEPPPGVTPEQVLAATIGPAAQRLTMTFASAAEYLDFWRDHPALRSAWSTEIERYLAYDLVGDPPQCRSSVTLDAVRDDSADMLDVEAVHRRPSALPRGTVFLRAPYGLMGEAGGLYPTELAERHAKTYPGLDIRDVESANHYTVVMAKPGAATVAAALEQVVS